MRLSGGQRQRISIARAFIRDAPIIILDEATASLDARAEAEIQAAVDRLEEHRTVICVAHRLSTLAAMDRIIVLEAGRIVEEGSFREFGRGWRTVRADGAPAGSRLRATGRYVQEERAGLMQAIRRLFVVAVGLAFTSSDGLGQTHADQPLQRVAFGSCNREYKPQPLWKQIIATRPDVWIWLGDIVYGEADELPELARRYDA